MAKFKPPVFGTIQALPPKIPEEGTKERNERNRIKCIKAGGTWDPLTNTCSLPGFEGEPDPNKIEMPKEEEEEQNKPPPPGTVITNAETGEPSGFINSQGNFVKASREDIQMVVDKQNAKTAPIEGGVTAKQYQEQQNIQRAIEQIGQIGKLDPAIQADINFSQAFTAGASKVLPGLLGGAATGAIAGSVVPGLGTAIGAIGGAAAGALGTFVGGTLGNIKEQQRGELQAADIELKNAKTNMRQLAMLASQDRANADIYIQQYNQQLTRVYQSRRQTKAEVTGDLNAFMEDGREQLADFDAFLQEGGIADVYGQKLKIALDSGVPLSINGEGLLE